MMLSLFITVSLVGLVWSSGSEDGVTFEEEQEFQQKHELAHRTIQASSKAATTPTKTGVWIKRVLLPEIVITANSFPVIEQNTNAIVGVDVHQIDDTDYVIVWFPHKNANRYRVSVTIHHPKTFEKTEEDFEVTRRTMMMVRLLKSGIYLIKVRGERIGSTVQEWSVPRIVLRLPATKKPARSRSPSRLALSPTNRRPQLAKVTAPQMDQQTPIEPPEPFTVMSSTGKNDADFKITNSAPYVTSRKIDKNTWVFQYGFIKEADWPWFGLQIIHENHKYKIVRLFPDKITIRFREKGDFVFRVRGGRHGGIHGGWSEIPVTV